MDTIRRRPSDERESSKDEATTTANGAEQQFCATRSLATDLSQRAFNNELFSDIKIECGDQMNQYVHAHKIILASRSDYFRALLCSGFRESARSNEPLIIQKPNIKYDTMKKVIEYIYTGMAKLERVSDATAVLVCSDELQLTELKQFCEKYLIDSIDVNNALVMLDIAHRYGCERLQAAVFEHVKLHTEDVLLSSTFLEISRDTLIRLLESEFLAIDELRIFAALLRWGLKRLDEYADMDPAGNGAAALPTSDTEEDDVESPISIGPIEYVPASSASAVLPEAPLTPVSAPTTVPAAMASVASAPAASASSPAINKRDNIQKNDAALQQFVKQDKRAANPGQSGTTSPSAQLSPRGRSGSLGIISSLTYKGSSNGKPVRTSSYIQELVDGAVGLNEIAAQLSEVEKSRLSYVLEDFLPFIRFPLMKAQELTESVEPFRIVPDWLLLEAYRYIAARAPISGAGKRLLARQALSDALTSEFEGSSILTQPHKQQLIQWCEGFNKGQKRKWHLGFKASKDGWDASIFHERCDEKGPTVVVCRTTEGYVFGGVAPASWCSTTCWRSSAEAFLFSLINPYNDGARQLKIKSPKHAIYNDRSFGPCFGGGQGAFFDPYDLYLDSTLRRGHTNAGCAYSTFRGGYRTTEAQRCLAGSLNNWLLTELEVYYLK